MRLNPCAPNGNGPSTLPSWTGSQPTALSFWAVQLVTAMIFSSRSMRLTSVKSADSATRPVERVGYVGDQEYSTLDHPAGIDNAVDSVRCLFRVRPHPVSQV